MQKAFFFLIEQKHNFQAQQFSEKYFAALIIWRKNCIEPEKFLK